MAVASLAMQITDYQDAACAQIYGGAGYSSLATAEKATIDRLILRAERTCFLHPPVDPPHVWSCLYDPGLITLWTDVTSTATSTVPVYTSTTAVTVGSAAFYNTMLGLNLVFDTSGTSYAISAYTSSTEITLTGDASGEVETTGTTSGTPSYSSPSSTITATAAVFTSGMVGQYLEGTSSGTAYLITSFTSTTVIVVTGDASGEVDAAFSITDTFTITGDGVYRLPTTFESPLIPSLVWVDNIWTERPQLMDEELVRSMRSRDTSTGYPRFAAIRWVSSDGTAAQSQELIVYPRSGGDYAAALPHTLQPVGMSTVNPYPLGGVEMADVLLSFVLAICEEERDGQRGDRWSEAIQKVAVAVKRDRSRHHNFIAGFMRSDSYDNPLELNVKSLIGTGTHP